MPKAQPQTILKRSPDALLASPAHQRMGLNPRSTRRVTEPQKKNPFSVWGDRPGRIVQPAADYGTIERNDSPEPLATNKADLGIQVETQCEGSVEIVHISRKKAIRLATKYLKQDASGFSSQTLKKVLEELPLLDEDGSPGPMDIEKQNSPTQLKLARRVLLGGGPQSPYNGSAYEKEIDPKAANAEPGAGASVPALGKRHQETGNLLTKH
ncbi:hypothetical protein RhiJN_24465 [Ceratobasidium sp. AG-Ba]|nr:hypothetical protein RhiJN_24465 [Ceratobasidium sp. AG-Ba]